MTGAECKAIKQKAARTRMAYAAKSRPTPRRGLFFRVARLRVTVAPPRLAVLPGSKKARMRARASESGNKRL